MSQLRPAWPAEQKGDPMSAFAERSTINSASDDNDDCSPYKHQPLDAISFRVLHLLPADQLDDTLRCKIQHVPFPKRGVQNIIYTALSYVWGNDHPSSCRVIVQNRHIMIRRNLDSALRHLRQRTGIITLWIDALCIDQSNIQERNHQVQHMRQIYETAEETIVYLGPQDGGNTGLSAWNYLGRNSSWALNDKGEKDFDAPTKLNNLTAFRGDMHNIYNDILPREWFRRLWVLQEFVVSKRISLQCGNHRVPGDTLFRLILFEPPNIDTYGHWAREEEEVEPIRQIWTTRVAFHIARNQQQCLPSWCKDASETITTNLLDTLVRAKGLIASDPRDKIIGLLGISSGFDWESNNTVDYNLTTRELYTKFAHDFLRTRQGFRILSYREGKSIQVRMDEVRRILDAVDYRLREIARELNRSLGQNLPGLDPYFLHKEEIQLLEMVRTAQYELNWLFNYAGTDKPLQQMLKYLQHDHHTPIRPRDIDDGSNELSTPSWVPTWRHRSSNIHYEARPIIEALHSKGAIPIRYRPSDVGAFLLPREDKAPDILRVQGKVIGVISTLISPCKLSSHQEEDLMYYRTEMRQSSQSGTVKLETNFLANLADILDRNAILELDTKRLKKYTFHPVGVEKLIDAEELGKWDFMYQFHRRVSTHSNLWPSFKNCFDIKDGRFPTGSIEYHFVEHISNPLTRTMPRPRNEIIGTETLATKRDIFQNRAFGLYRPSPPHDREIHIPPNYLNESPPRQNVGINDNSERLESHRAQSGESMKEEGNKGAKDEGRIPVLEWTPGSSRGLALLPLDVEFGDLIVYFPGAQVPFIVRRLEKSTTEGLEHQDSTEGLRFADDVEHHIHCELVGECWINDFPQIEQEMGKLDCLFHIS